VNKAFAQNMGEQIIRKIIISPIVFLHDIRISSDAWLIVDETSLDLIK